jgi:ethanolamine ammonia-lyase small subunit
VAEPDPWLWLRQFTPARLALGRSGAGLPTAQWLAFQLAQAEARDAVGAALDLPHLQQGLASLGLPWLALGSLATSREQYLLRPDLGRQLSAASQASLAAVAPPPVPPLALVLADGLSAEAVNRHALPLLAQLRPHLQAAGWPLAPVALVQQGRVAVGDPIGHGLGATAVLVLIGERPGLSAPHSLGAYLTWQPRPGLTDEARNCVSNIRPEGLPYPAAADKLRYLLGEMRRLQLSGVQLKDEQPPGHLGGGEACSIGLS